MSTQRSLKKNIIANYIGQAYKALIGIFMMPLYLSYLGSEAFGLIGFYIMLQSWMQLLDLGMKPTLARESARYRAGSIDTFELRTVLRTLETIFVSTGLVMALGIIFLSSYISSSWLKVENLDLKTVSYAVCFMGIVVGTRWVSSLYSGVISGLERQVWLNSFEIISNTVRFVGVLGAFYFFDASIMVFFIYQMIVSIFELLVIQYFTYTNFEKIQEKISYSFEVLKKIYKFSFAIAFGSIIWVVVTQIDKLILSKTIALEQYGYFSLAIVIANGVFVLGNAISGAIMPRLVYYSERKDEEGFKRVYFFSLEIALMVVVPISALLVIYAQEILYLWTHDEIAAQNASKILIWYVLGNVIVSSAAFAYYLQYAKGDLKLHVRGNLIYAIILIPLQIYIASNYGPIETGILWFIINLCFLLFWIGFIHKKFLKGEHIKWLYNIIKMFIGGYGVVLIMKYYILDIQMVYSMMVLIKLFLVGIVSFLFTLLFSTQIRQKIFTRFLNAK